MVAQNWSSPTLTTLVTDFLTEVKRRDEHIMTMDYASDTNITDTTVRYNRSTNKFEEYDSGTTSWTALPFHTTIDDHIADSDIHQPFPVGCGLDYFGASAPSGWLFRDGTAVSRVTYLDLFNVIGTTYGAGDGSTTFNLPDDRGRFALGKAASGTGNTLGATGGSLDHTHTTPNHTHTIATHVHGLNSHTHVLNDHAHTSASHYHWVPAHYHDVTANGGTINITSSGSHDHTYAAKNNSTAGSGQDRTMASSATGTNVTYTVSTNGSSHVHAAVNFAGTVGAYPGESGDIDFASDVPTYSSGSATSGVNSGPGSTQAASGDTAGSGTLTSNSGEGSGTSGTSNPAFIVCNKIIKY